MSFLIKLALLVTVVVFCIPADPAELARSGSAPRTVGIFDAYSFAQAIYSDAGGFCGRNPAACDTGAALGDVFSAKARTATRWVQNYLTPSHKEPTETATPTQPQPMSQPMPMSGVAPTQPMPGSVTVQAHDTTGAIEASHTPAPPRKPATIRQDT